MARYGMDFGPRRMYGGGMNRDPYGVDYFSGYGGGPGRYGGGFSRTGVRYAAEYGGFGGPNHPGAFRGRGRAYDSYYRRDFLTNQGDFSPDFGGGPEYGYHGAGTRGGRFAGPGRGYQERGHQGFGGSGPGAYDRGWGGYDRGYDRGWGGYDRGMRGGDRISYGPGYGERWESTHPEDIARRNFDRW